MMLLFSGQFVIWWEFAITVMMSKPLGSKMMLGAAFAGLAVSSADANTVFNEADVPTTGDFGTFSSPTDLTGEFANFLNDSGVQGQFLMSSTIDFSDVFDVTVLPSVSASIPYEFNYIAGSGQISFSVHDTSNVQLASAFIDPVAGPPVVGSLDFTTPANGIIRFALNGEGGVDASYVIGTVPEPSTGILGMAAIAAAALRRRREQA